MQVTALDISEVKLVEPRVFGDSRGFFSEVYNARALAEVGIDVTFCQDNHSLSRPAGTVRGLHFQAPPYAQDKLVRVPRGRVLDVAVDLRVGSPTYGQHVSAELSAEKWNQLFVPKGFAHGFCTLEDDTEVVYKVSAHYAPEHDFGVLWNDPALAIAWPVAAANAIVSEKDARQPRLADLPTYFTVS
jgi:dTDP-4-dehydrorhamnose 3,5-epimerase